MARNFTNVKKVFYNDVFTESYNVTEDGENKCFPVDLMNKDWVDLKTWIDGGGSVSNWDIGK
jgi:hypothetical protein